MDKLTTGNETLITERRKHTELRTIFPDACVRIAPCLYSHNDWVGSPIEYLAQRKVHETYPNLNSTEVRTLITAIDRYVQMEFAP